MNTELMVKDMLSLQDKVNSKANPNWEGKGFPWRRAIWVECAEMLDHYGWKWWKMQDTDLEQVKLELVDIWHFVLSLLLQEFDKEDAIELLVQEIESDYKEYRKAHDSIPEVIEYIVFLCLDPSSEEDIDILVGYLRLLMYSIGFSFEDLYKMYIGKNALNNFRQDNGYKEGTYIKEWRNEEGTIKMEDNEFLSEVLEGMPDDVDNAYDYVYHQLSEHYRLHVVFYLQRKFFR